MPRYDYHCLGCHDDIEVIHSIKESPKVDCAKCGESRVRRIGSVASIFKGDCWAKDGYK